MPIRVNPIPRPIAVGYNEGSVLRSGLDEHALGRQWHKNQAIAGQIAWLTESVKRIQDEINKLRLRKGGQETAGRDDCPYG